MAPKLCEWLDSNFGAAFISKSQVGTRTYLLMSIIHPSIERVLGFLFPSFRHDAQGLAAFVVAERVSRCTRNIPYTVSFDTDVTSVGSELPKMNNGRANPVMATSQRQWLS